MPEPSGSGNGADCGADRAVAAPRGADGADVVIAALRRAGVELVFGLPGVHNLSFWSAAERAGLRLVGVRHEQTAVYAADGAARVSGELAVAVTTTGPGAANALGATGEAWASGSPVLVIATNIATSLARPGVYRGALHETRDQGAMFEPVVKSVLRVGAGSEVASKIEFAAALAMAAPTGPVYVEIPTDLLAAPTTDEGAVVEPGAAAPDAGAIAPTAVAAVPRAPDPVEIEAALVLLRDAERPVVWAGGGAMRAGAGAALRAVAEKLGAPVIETYMARGTLAVDSPCWVGLPPHLPAVGALWDEADVVLAVGTDFDGMMTQNWRMPAPPHLVAVNVDAADAAKNYIPDVTVVADARLALEAIEAALPAAGDLGPLASRLQGIRGSVREGIRDEEPRAGELLHSLAAAVGPETAVFADMCIPGYWTAGFHAFGAPRRLAYPVGWGTLGFAFPASLGAALAAGHQTLCISGDGGFLFALGELATLAQEGAPLTILLVDDGGYGMLRYDQEAAGHALLGVDLKTPDWSSLLGSFGIPSEEVAGFGAPLAEALAARLAGAGPGAILVRRSLLPPPTTSPRWYRHRLQPHR